MQNQKFLVLGGKGKTGRRIAERLTQLGHPVRIGSRSATPAFDWEAPSTRERRDRSRALRTNPDERRCQLDHCPGQLVQPEFQ